MKTNDIGGLHIKYRPKDFDRVIGNQATVKSLQSMLKRDKNKIPHVFLLAGNYGCGKSSLARIIAKHLGCANCDIKEIDAGTDRGVKSADDLKSTLKYSAREGDVRVIIIDEIQETSGGKYQGSLLKTLEDGCPKHVYFILCTTNPEKINNGILSRATKYQVKLLSVEELIKLIKRVCKKENKTIPIPFMRRVAESSEGSPRNALTLLDSIIDLENPKDMREVLKNSQEIILSGMTEDKNVIELCKALMKGARWTKIREIIKNIDTNPETVRIIIRNYFTSVLLNSNGRDKCLLADIILKCFQSPFYTKGKGDLVTAVREVIS